MSSLGFLRYIDRRTLKRLIFAVLAAAWCGLIFYLSSQPGDESSRTSGGFINFFCELIVPDFSGFTGAGRAEFVENLQFIVRKCAHFTAYLVLAVISSQFFVTFKKLANEGVRKPLKAYAAAWIFTTAYAASDEFHQLFVAGRSAQVRDVLIDSCGALCGLALTWAVGAAALHFSDKKRKEREND